jgi:hypothetical protein
LLFLRRSTAPSLSEREMEGEASKHYLFQIFLKNIIKPCRIVEYRI